MTKQIITGVGIPTQDRTYHAPELPRFEQSVLAYASQSEGGGQAATALVAAARLGHDASLIGSVGDDAEGAAIREGLRSAGVATDFVEAVSGARSSTALILVNADGQRAIMYDPGSKLDLSLSDDAAICVASSHGLLLERNSGITMHAAQVARAHGTKTLLDYDAYLGEVPELLGLSDIVIASEAVKGMQNAEETLDLLLSHGCAQAVVTCGSQGAVGKDKDGTVHTEPAYPVDVVDTTGAGDVYHGAYLVAVLEGAGLAEAMRFAAIVAGLKCEVFGGRSGIPERARVDVIIRDITVGSSGERTEQQNSRPRNNAGGTNDHQ